MKKVIYRKTKDGIVVRTPDGKRVFANESNRSAKAYFRSMLDKFKQPYIPKTIRKGMKFQEIVGLTHGL